MDIGKPHDYLVGQLNYQKRRAELGEGATNSCIIHETATVEEGAELGPNVVIGAGCHIESGVKIVHATIMSGTKVKKGAYIFKCIVGWENTIGKWARLEKTFTGEDVQVKDTSFLESVNVLPHKAVEGTKKNEIIM